MKKIAGFALSVVLVGVLGCSSPPELTVKQRKTVEYLRAIADQKDDDANKTEALAMAQFEKARQLREEAVKYREKAKLVIKGQDIDEMERSLGRGQR